MIKRTAMDRRRAFAERLYMRGETMARIAKTLRVSESTVQCDLKDFLRPLQRPGRGRIKSSNGTRVHSFNKVSSRERPTADVLRERDDRYSYVPNANQYWLGDPPPGMSALDRKRA